MSISLPQGPHQQSSGFSSLRVEGHGYSASTEWRNTVILPPRSGGTLTKPVPLSLASSYDGFFTATQNLFPLEQIKTMAEELPSPSFTNAESGNSDRPGQEKKLPNTFQLLIDRFPELVQAHDRMAEAVDGTGPLDHKTCALIKIGISVGAGLESAVRSHVRRATHFGATQEEIEQAIFQGMNTVGFPRTVAAWSWAHMQFERDRHHSKPPSDP